MAEIITVQAGALATNCYIVGDPVAGECAVVDAGGDPERISDAIRAAGWNVRYVLATHGHADHTGAVAPIVESHDGQFGAGRDDAELVRDPQEWLAAILMDFQQPPEPALFLDGGETLQVGQVSMEVLATPGHTPGSICFRVGDSVLTGDTLFNGSIGRFDLPGGDGEQELASIGNVLMTLDDSIAVLPGHGPPSSIGDERRSNPFLNG